MKKEFSKNTTEVFTKVLFHYVPDILKYIDEIKEPRKRYDYSMRYLIMSEMVMFLSENIALKALKILYCEKNKKIFCKIAYFLRKKFLFVSTVFHKKLFTFTKKYYIIHISSF